MANNKRRRKCFQFTKHENDFLAEVGRVDQGPQEYNTDIYASIRTSEDTFEIAQSGSPKRGAVLKSSTISRLHKFFNISPNGHRVRHSGRTTKSLGLPDSDDKT